MFVERPGPPDRAEPPPSGLHVSAPVTAKKPLVLAEQPDTSPLVFKRVMTPSLAAPNAASLDRNANVATDVSTHWVIGTVQGDWIPQFTPSNKAN
jgi:hypothetical protein